MSYGWNTAPVPPASITVDGNMANTNGQIFTVLPDNTTKDITPQAPPQRYTYTINPIKYSSSFTVYVCQPDTSFPYSIWLPGINAGHAWWCLSCDASIDIVSNVTQNGVNLEYLGVQVGYGPTNGISLWNPSTKAFVTAPGVFPWPNTDIATTNVTYAIGFWDLISGLNYAEGIKANPGTYSIANPVNDCVSKTRECGSRVGITLPRDNTPEWFGFHLPPSNQ
jgi:hypothetical protein